jgi:hypothetical protein
MPLSREEFIDWLHSPGRGVEIVRQAPYEVAPCTCGDMNCKGWKLVQLVEHQGEVFFPFRREPLTPAELN